MSLTPLEAKEAIDGFKAELENIKTELSKQDIAAKLEELGKTVETIKAEVDELKEPPEKETTETTETEETTETTETKETVEEQIEKLQKSMNESLLTINNRITKIAENRGIDIGSAADDGEYKSKYAVDEN